MNKLDTKFAQVDQNLEKQLGNQNKTFTSIIDRLEKRLEKQLEGVNQTLKSLTYGMVF